MVRPKRKDVPDFNIHEDLYQPFPGNVPPDTQSRDLQLQGILTEAIANSQQKDAIDVYKLQAATDFAHFFKDQVTVP